MKSQQFVNITNGRLEHEHGLAHNDHNPDEF